MRKFKIIHMTREQHKHLQDVYSRMDGDASRNVISYEDCCKMMENQTLYVLQIIKKTNSWTNDKYARTILSLIEKAKTHVNDEVTINEEEYISIMKISEKCRIKGDDLDVFIKVIDSIKKSSYISSR